MHRLKSSPTKFLQPVIGVRSEILVCIRPSRSRLAAFSSPPRFTTLDRVRSSTFNRGSRATTSIDSTLVSLRLSSSRALSAESGEISVTWAWLRIRTRRFSTCDMRPMLSTWVLLTLSSSSRLRRVRGLMLRKSEPDRSSFTKPSRVPIFARFPRPRFRRLSV